MIGCVDATGLFHASILPFFPALFGCGFAAVWKMQQRSPYERNKT